jgi:hypothetical protein
MRIFGIILILIGLLICLTIVGIPIGLGFMLIGAICAAFGGRRRTIITNVVQVSNTPGAQQAQVPFDGDGLELRHVGSSRPEPRLINSLPSTSERTLPPIVVEQVGNASAKNYDYDRHKWNALVEYDEDIKRIVDTLAVR